MLIVWSLISVLAFALTMASIFASPQSGSLDPLVYAFVAGVVFFFSMIPTSGYLRLVKGKKGGGELIYAPCILPLLGIVPSLAIILNGFSVIGVLQLAVSAFLVANVVIGFQAKKDYRP